eukprot:TRINITY_DN4512_c0_g1_i1.p2 TRINITY_DN4512_c0_g1~~TRINITY_DN4512_c0_g1_i1.p2  ORF type:complete len:208 (-),score=109.16 TRINITY_DN4512_c0_g1_i1:27-650(-)
MAYGTGSGSASASATVHAPRGATELRSAPSMQTLGTLNGGGTFNGGGMHTVKTIKDIDGPILTYNAGAPSTPGGLGGQCPCEVCGNHYPTHDDVEIHKRKRHPDDPRTNWPHGRPVNIVQEPLQRSVTQAAFAGGAGGAGGGAMAAYAARSTTQQTLAHRPMPAPGGSLAARPMPVPAPGGGGGGSVKKLPPTPSFSSPNVFAPRQF